MLKKILILSIFSLFVFCPMLPSHSANNNVTAEILNFGTYELVGRSIIVNSPESAVGKRRFNTKPKFLKRTTTIPAILGNSFGFRYKTYGMPTNSLVELKKVFTHPEINGKTNSSSKLRYHTDSEGSIEKTTGYTFDKEFELVPGIWTIEIWYDENLLVKKSFNIVPQI